jgi:hypothetical protein
MVESAQDFDRFLNQQLERLQLDKLDFYLFHGLNAQSWAKVRDLQILKWAECQMSQGKFDHLGFSFHDSFEAFKGIIDSYDNWALGQIQYNYMDVEHQAGRRGVEYAASKNIAIVVMEPLRGGKLSKKPPKPVAEVFEAASQLRSPVEWALRWVWNQPEVSVALSGMSTMDQVIENVTLAENAEPGVLTAEDLSMFDRVREAYRGLTPIPCTTCRYCMPCPNGVEIPEIFQIYNEAATYDEFRMGRLRYNGERRGLKPEQRADRCLECGQCLEACPQKIPIPDWLKKAHAALVSVEQA